MVVKERQRLTIQEAEKIITESKDKQEAIEMLHCLKPTRQKAPPPPEGAIGIRQAARKYGVSHTAIEKWVLKGLVPVIKKTINWTYVDEESIRKITNNQEN